MAKAQELTPSARAEAQKVSPSTVYSVQGSPNDYDYVLKGADLVLVNKETHEEQVFLFVGNIMSLDGQVDMKFSDGENLESKDIFNRSEMLDMDKLDEEAPEWKANSEDSTPSDEEEGNSDESNLAGEQQDPIQTAQAALMTDPTDDILKSQQRMFDDIQKFSKQESLSSDVSGQAGEKLQSEDVDQPDEKDDPKNPEDQEDPNKDDPTKHASDANNNSGNITIELSQDSESGIRKDPSDNTSDFVKDGITNHTNFKLVGTADPDTKLDIYMNGEKIGEATANEDGDYSIDISNADSGESKGLGSVVHEFYAQLAGSTSENPAKSSTVKVEVDTTDPTLGESGVTYNSEENGKYYTNDDRPLLEGTGEKDTILHISYSNKDGSVSGTLEQVTVNSSGNWSIRIPENEDGKGLADGEYTFTITGEDDAGNALTANAEIQNVVIKTSFETSAEITLDDTTNSRGIGVDPNNEDTITNSDTLDLTIKAISTEAREVTVMLVLDGGKTQALGDAVFDEDSGTWKYTVDSNIIPDNADYKFMVKATDMAGNTNTPGSDLVVTIDREAPDNGLTIDLDSASDSEDSNHALSRVGDDPKADNYTHGTEEGHSEGKGMLILNGEHAGNQGLVNLYRVDADGDYIDENGSKTDTPVPVNATPIEADPDGDWTYSYDANSIGTNGAESIHVRAEITDAAGNIEHAELTVTVDNDAPVESTIYVENALETKETAEGFSTSVTGKDVTVSGIITEGKNDVIVTIYDKDGNEIANSAENPDLIEVIASGDNFKWSYVKHDVEHEHDYSYYATVEDAAGNVTKSDLMTFTSDQGTGKPDITLDASTDTSTKGDNITDFITENDNGTKVENHKINLKVSADDDAKLEIYQVVEQDSGYSNIVLIDAEHHIYGIKIETGGDVVNGDVVTFNAENYDDTATELKFVTVATDEAGNTATSDVYTMVLDDSDPVDTNGITVTAVMSEDGGTTVDCADDAYSSAKALELSGSFTDLIDTDIDIASPVVRVYDGGSEIGTATVEISADGEYTWSFKLGDEGSEDTYIEAKDYSFKIEIEDAAGNITTVPADATETMDVHIDRSPPEIIADLGENQDTGRSEEYTGDWITSVTNDLSVEVTSNEGATITVKINDNTEIEHVVTDAEAQAGKITFNIPDTQINHGSNNVVITATDLAGNSTTVEKELVIDTEVDTSSIRLASGSNSGFSTDNATDDHTPTFEGLTEKSALVKLTVHSTDGDGNEITHYSTSKQALADGSWNIDVPQDHNLPDGTYTVTAEFTDITGNSTSVDLEPSLIISSAPDAPEVSMTSDTTAYFYDGIDTANDWVTRDAAPDFTVKKSVGTTLDVIVTKAGDPDFEYNPEYTGNTSDTAEAIVTQLGDLADGEYTFTFITADQYGNATEVVKTVVIDNHYEHNEFTMKMAPESDTGTSDIDINDIILTNDDTPELSGIAEKNSKARMMVMSFDSKAALESYTDNFANMTDESLRTFIAANEAQLGKEVIVNSDGTWIANPELTADGYYKVIVISEDQAGNVEAKSMDIQLDTTLPDPPKIDITDDDHNPYAEDANGNVTTPITDLSPRIAGSYTLEENVKTTITISNEKGDYTRTLDARAIDTDNDGTWEYHYDRDGNDTYLHGGNYTATITSVDEAGNESSDTIKFTIDQSTYKTPTIGLAEEDDTGVKGDGRTSLQVLAEIQDDAPENPTPDDAPKLTLTGHAIAYHEVAIYRDGESEAFATVKAEEDGAWSYTLESNPTDSDTHEYYVVVDGTKSDVFKLTVDNSTPPPEVTLTNDTGINGDWITSDSTIEGKVEPGSTVELTATKVYELTDGHYIDDAGNQVDYTGEVTTIGDKNYYVGVSQSYFVKAENIQSDGSYKTAELKTLLSDGQYQISVTGKDIAGNITTNVIDDKVLHLDTTTVKPDVDLSSISDTSFAKGEIIIPGADDKNRDVYDDLPGDDASKELFKSDKLTNDSTPTLQGNAEANALISIAIDGTSDVYTTHADSTGAWSYTLDTPLSDGSHSITVTATDTAGNSKSSDERSINVDSGLSKNAEISVVQESSPGHGGEGNIFYTRDDTPELKLSGEAGAAYVLYYNESGDPDNPTYVKIDANYLGSDGTTTIVPSTQSLADGEHYYKLVTVDEAGNSNTTDYTVVVDSVPPTPAEGISFTYHNETETGHPLETKSAEIVDEKDSEGNLSKRTFTVHTNNDTTDLVVDTGDGTTHVRLVDASGKTIAENDVSAGECRLDLTNSEITNITDGEYNYSLEFYDHVGNKSTTEVDLRFIVNTEAPTTTIKIDSASDRGTNTEAYILTSGDSFTFKGTLTEDRIADHSDANIDYTDLAYLITVEHGGDTWTYDSTADNSENHHFANVHVGGTGEYSFDVVDNGHPLENGDYSVTIQAVDLAGNITDTNDPTAQHVDFTVDNTTLHTTDLQMTERIFENPDGTTENYVTLNQSDYIGVGDSETANTTFGYEVIKHDIDTGHSVLSSTGDIADGDDIQISLRNDNHEFEYAEVKVTGAAGNESHSQYIDLDHTDLNYSENLGSDDHVDKVSLSLSDNDGHHLIDATFTEGENGEATLHYDSNHDGSLDATLTTDTTKSQSYDGGSVQLSHSEDGWAISFSQNLTAHNYDLNISSTDTNTPANNHSNDINFSLKDLTQDVAGDEIFTNTDTDTQQDFNGAHDGNGGDTPDTTSDTSVVVNTEIHQDHIVFNIA